MVKDSTSSVSVLITANASIAFLKLLTIRSGNPLKCGALDGFNFQFFGFWATKNSISDWFPAAILSRTSLDGPTKFYAISLRIILGFLLRAMILIMAARHESTSKLDSVSTCTALVVKHVNKQHQRFKGILKTYTWNGPKQSTPVLANGNTLSSSLPFGRFDMKS